jgi:hypothetical protein
MRLWREWYRCVRLLRPSCSRVRTYLWLVVTLVGLCTRPDRAGVTSFIRGLGLAPAAYHRILHFFHSPAVDLDRLTTLWARLVVRIFSPLQVGSYLVCLADGVKAPKEGHKMPAVKSLHQSSDSNSKPTYIMGHSLQAASLLVRGPTGHLGAVPLIARIHEGLVWSNRDRRTLLDKMVTLFLSLAHGWEHKVILVADAFYASKKVIRPLLKRGHHLVTRVRTNTVAYEQATQPRKRQPGRPRFYGTKLRLKELAGEDALFQSTPSPIYGESGVEIRYRSIDLLWRPVAMLVRFVIVRHPHRGLIFLMTTHTDLHPLDVLVLYSHRFKIEVGFRQGIHVLGAYAYHFWMKLMTPLRRRQGDQYLHMKTKLYREQIHRKIKAYHLHVQLGCIAQGLLIHLALNFGSTVWRQFRSWLRTMKPDQPPSELVVAYALRDQLPEFLEAPAGDEELRKLILRYRRPNTEAMEDVA